MIIDDVANAMQRVLDRLSVKRLPLEDEKETQRAIAAALAEAPTFAFEREVHVTGGIIDFMVATIGIEVKLKGGAGAIGRQLRRYAGDPGIAGLIFVTAKPIILGSTIGGKPLAVLNLGRGWL